MRAEEGSIPPNGAANLARSASRLACPWCAGPLRGRETVETTLSISCEPCGRSFSRPDGIHDLSTREFYWNHLPRAAMASLEAAARRDGWLSALDRALRPAAGDYVHRYAVDERRSDFACLLRRDAEAPILDLGCGWGAVTAGLARAFREVVSADSTLETLRFVALRLEHDGLTHVTLARIDPLGTGRLPFRDSQFGAVVLNGVLEWVGHSRADVPVRRLQERTLREVRRCLRPSGLLYLGIENRFGIEAWRGAKDHNGLRFTSLLPRPLASLVSRWRLHQDYRTYTYSLSGYRRLLERVGFTRASLFLPKPSYRNPEYILTVEREALRYYFSRVSTLKGGPRALAKLLAGWGLYPYVADSFAWIAEVPA